jgi:GDP/UDP-N,N'-diacetylbacillosamine 2-epimerase (hydrolysing)
MKKKIKVIAFTGTRADYPRVKKVLEKIKLDKNFDLKIAVSGTHVLKEYGNTYKEIIQDGFKIYKKFSIYESNYDTLYGATTAISNCTKKFAKILKNYNPDIVLITVDRIETLGATIPASIMNFPIAHIQGGEVTGTIDENIRHAVTKLSHIHFVANEDAKKRIIKLGEKKSYVFNVGCPYVDLIKSTKKIPKERLFKKLNLDINKKTIILIQHAVTTEFGESKDQIFKTIKVLKKLDHNKFQVFSIYSNADPGSKEIIKQIKKAKFNLVKNIISDEFINLMRHSNLIIGNSSCGIREAPSFKLPAINIGSRQNKRLRTRNVVDIDHKVNEIESALKYVLNNKNFKRNLKKVKNPYGDGYASEKIVKILKKLNLSKITNKVITY